MAAPFGRSRPVKPFHFAEGQPKPAIAEDKENLPNDNYGKQSEINSKENESSSQNISASQSKPPPSTPAARLPLAELLGDNDDFRLNRPKPAVSPEEQLGWAAMTSPRSANSKATPGTRGHKRAHSSTPPSASQRSAMKKAKHKAAIDLEELKKSLRTPQTDPATQLWNRYNGGITRDTPLGKQLASLATGFTSSSPYNTDDQTGNVSGLRRWTSCGMEFPSAKRKRRKVQDVTEVNGLGEVPEELPRSRRAEPADREKTTRIGSLLEKISESLERSKRAALEEQAPSSSSPLPERKEDFDRASISPMRAPELAETLGDIPRRTQSQRREVTISEEDADRHTSYGSDAEVAEASQTVNNLQLQKNKQDNKILEEDFDAFDDDDFGDDFDLSVEDFDDMTTAITVQQPPRVTHKPSSPLQLHRSQKQPLCDADDLDAGSDDVDEELFAAAEATATQSHSTASRYKSPVFTSQGKRRPRAIQRYLVNDVYESDYVTNNGRRQLQKMLSVRDEKTGALKAVTLRDSWADTRCTEGSYVHVVGTFDKHGHCIVTDAENMIILHPDHLISATAVGDSFSCMRKAVLQDRIKATSEPSAPMLYGTIIHEIFQDALKANRWDEEWLHEIINTRLDQHVEELYQTRLTLDGARQYLESKVPELQAWAGVFVKTGNEGLGAVKDRNGTVVQMSVNKLLDVEEHIWSPMYGLKGNIDATVQVAMEVEDGGDAHTLTVPLELKTGKRENASHRAQTALYTLLLSDRYDVAVAYGVLYYIETSQMHRIPAIRHELRHMVMQRNELACFVRDRLALPPLLRNTHTCGKCYAKEPCFLYHRLVEDGNGETSGMRDKFDTMTKQLKPAHQDFFKKWDDLLTKEESEILKFRRELWTMLSQEREKLGRCFANVSLIVDGSTEATGSSKINRHIYSFQKHTDSADFSFSESQIAVGDPIVVSDERGHYALAKGYVTSLTKNRLCVAVDRRLHNARAKLAGFDAEANQVFAGITDPYSAHPSQHYRSQAVIQNDTVVSSQAPPILYRIDKDEFSNGMALVRANLLALMSATAFQASRLRSLIVDNAAPTFKSSSTAYIISDPPSRTSMNPDQTHVIEKILTAEHYALVLGMPGTGKTTTIAQIIRALVAKGRSVLLASYTHSAVDNILLKLRHDRIPILRLGALAKIHPDVSSFASLAAEPRATITELEDLYHLPQVVATTCLGINHPIFNERTFDYCIVDEASQITLPVCLGPIRLARAFVLVGDHFQLPPLVQNRAALEGGLDVSLFKSLCERQPDAVVELGVQYRMNAEIMRMANELIYGGRLKCGSESVASRRLGLPRWDGLNVKRDSWQHKCLAPTSPPLVFLDTDLCAPHHHEIAHGARVTNALEASLAVALVTTLITAGVPAPTIGVITLYRSQLALIKSSLVTALGPLARDVEAHTADRFQGRDKEVVVLSCVRSNERGVVGELLRDWRRVNVAITRARSKMLVLGSKSTLSQGDELLSRMIAVFEKERSVVNVKTGWEGEVPVYRGMEGPGATQSSRPRIDNASPRTALAPVGERDMNKPRGSGPHVGSPGKENRPPLRPGQKPFKMPTKVAKGGLRVKKGPVLEDLMAEILGDEDDF